MSSSSAVPPINAAAPGAKAPVVPIPVRDLKLFLGVLIAFMVFFISVLLITRARDRARFEAEEAVAEKERNTGTSKKAR